MNNPRRITPQLLAVLRVLVDQAAGEQLYGRILAEHAGLTSGAVTGILARLARLGWLDERWETVPAGTARPARKYVRLTPSGREAARQVLAGRRASAPKGSNSCTTRCQSH